MAELYPVYWGGKQERKLDGKFDWKRFNGCHNIVGMSVNDYEKAIETRFGLFRDCGLCAVPAGS
jgi:hypothetical protein